MKHWAIPLALWGGSAMLFGCGGGHGLPPPPNLQGTVHVQVVFPAAGRAAAEIAKVVLTITGSEMRPITVDLRYDEATHTATGSAQVPRGIDRKFEVKVYDASNNVLYSGEETADVEAGRTLELTIHLYPPERGLLRVEATIPDVYLGLGKIGMCYSPFRDGQNPDRGIFPTEAEMAEDIQILSRYATGLRTYGSAFGLEAIPRLAREAGLECLAGAWVSADEEATKEEIEGVVAAANAGYCKAVIVGSEVLLRNSPSEATLINYIRDVQRRVSVPVGYGDVPQELLNNPNVVQEVDLIVLHSYPFWEGVEIGHAAPKVIIDLHKIRTAYPDKQVVLGETGWPSAGQTQGQAVPTAVHQRRFLTELVGMLRTEGIEFYFFEAFDEKWKTVHEGSVGANWGLFFSNRQLKPEIRKVLF